MNSKLKLTIYTLSFLLCFCFARHASAATCNDIADGNWNNSATWDCAKTPGSGDTVTIDSHSVTMVGDQSALSVTISGGTLNMGSYTLTDSGNWTYSSGTVNAGTSTLKFVGLASVDFMPGSVAYYNVDIAQGGGYTVTLQSDLVVTNVLTVEISNTSFNTSNKTIRTKNFIQTNGIFAAGSSNIILTGNFTHTAGTFTANTSTVAFQGTNQTITGTTTFYRLYKLVNAADTLTIANGTNITIATGGIMRLWGKPEGKTLSLRSSTPGSSYMITKTGSFEAEYCDFQDANFSATVTAAASNSTSGNTNLTVTKEFISTIRATGGDYSTLSAWEAAANCDLTAAATKVFSISSKTGTLPDNSAVTGGTSSATATLVHASANQILLKSISGTFQNGEQVRIDGSNYAILSDAGFGAIAVANPYNDWVNGLDDLVTISGQTTDATHYMKIYVPIAQRHNGIIGGAGFFIKSTSNAANSNLEIVSNYTVIDGLKIERTSANNSSYRIVGISSNGGSLYFDNSIVIKNCLLYQSSGGSVSIFSNSSSNTNGYGAKIYNNILVSNSDTSTGGMSLQLSYNNSAVQKAEVYNNTIYGKFTGSGLYVSVTNTASDTYKPAIFNNYVMNSGAGNDYGFINQYSNALSNFAYNASDDGTSGTANNNKTVTLTNAQLNNTTVTTADVHLKNSSQLINSGFDLSADSAWPVISDIDRESRLALDPNAWSIGADQYSDVIKESIGAAGTSGQGTAATFGSSSEYCVPGDTSPCASPVGEWKMDDKVSGDTKTISDTSGNGNNGTTHYGANATGMNCMVQGKFGGGCGFDGVDDYYNVANNSSLNNSQFTVSMWVKGNLAPDSSVIKKAIVKFANDASSANTFSFNWSHTGVSYRQAWEVYNGSQWFPAKYTTSLLANNWYYLTATYDGSNLRAYLNGKLETTTPTSGTISTGTGSLFVGSGGTNSNSPSNYFSGSIDQVRVYNYARTPAQIAWEYNKGKPIAEYRFNECTGATIHDESGSGNNGTINLGASGQTTTGTCSASANTPWYNGRTGKNDASLNFDGVDDYVDMGNGAGIQFDNGNYSFSVSTWIKPNSVSSHDRMIIGRWGSNAAVQSWVLKIESDDASIKWAYHGTSAMDFSIAKSTASSVQAGNWHHLVGVKSGNEMKLYINGKLAASDNSFPGSIFDTSQNLTIGYGNQSDQFSGQTDDVKIFNYALTADQVKTVYNGGAVSFR